MNAPAQYAPAAVRDAFLDALERNDRPLSERMAQSLTTCGNPLPGMICDELQLPHGSSYGAAARLILQRCGA
jgi:hypothetical protein